MVCRAKSGGLHERYAEFSELLYWMFHTEEGGCQVKLTYRKMGIAQSTLHNYIQGARAFPLNQLAPLCRATGSTLPLRYFAEQVGATVVELPEFEHDVTHEVMMGVVKSQLHHVDAVREIMESLENDGRITFSELAGIQERILAAMRALAQVGHAVELAVEAGR